MLSRAFSAQILRHAAGRLVDLALPPRCLACGSTLSGGGELCPTCWRGIDFLGAPCCARCGLPFPFESGQSETAEEAQCGACLADPPPFDRARAVFRYAEASRGLVLGFKHGDRTHAAPAFGRWMARSGGELLAEADVLLPVPLHWTRLFLRRYNQAALLAHAIRAAGGPPVRPDWLVRKRRTPSQGHRTRTGRAENVKGAFALAGGADVAGKQLVLIDDVLTSGATVGECARLLRRAGAARVDVLTLARVLPAGAS